MSQKTQEEGKSSDKARHAPAKAPKGQQKSDGASRGAARVKKPPFADKAPAYPVPSDTESADDALEIGISGVQTPDESVFAQWWQATGKVVATGVLL